MSELHAPWGFTVESSPIAKFHLVLAGSGWLTLDDRAPVRLDAGDLVLLPGGEEHSLGHRTGPASVSLTELLQSTPLLDDLTLRIDGHGPATRLLCGGFVLGVELPHSSTSLLPRVLLVDAAALAISTWLEPVLLTLAGEAERRRPGTQVMQAKIAELFIAEALRSWLIDAQSSGLLVGAELVDRPIAQALETIRQRFDERWTRIGWPTMSGSPARL